VKIHGFLKCLPKNPAAAAPMPRRYYKNLSHAATVFEKICRCRDTIAMDISTTKLNLID
jgi:hypothetical protein